MTKLNEHIETLESFREYCEGKEVPFPPNETFLLDICLAIKKLEEKPRLHVYDYGTNGHELSPTIKVDHSKYYIGYLTLTENDHLGQ